MEANDITLVAFIVFFLVVGGVVAKILSNLSSDSWGMDIDLKVKEERRRHDSSTTGHNHDSGSNTHGTTPVVEAHEKG